MRVTLLHKPSAGDGTYSPRTLIGLFEKHGHTVHYRSTDDNGWSDALDRPADCVVAAGGDGTVGSVGLRLAGRDVPLAIIPLGTANNIALRLGLTEPPEAFIARLTEARRTPFDLGVARGPWGEHRFVEGVGIGAFPRAMTFADTEEGELIPEPPARHHALYRDLRLLRAFLRDLNAHACTIVLNGDVQETSYLLLEMTNTGLIGPNVDLAPKADCGDGLLDVVVVGEAARLDLETYLTARMEGEEAVPPVLPVRQVKTARLSVAGARVHVDADVWPHRDEPLPNADASFDVEVHVEPGALEVLVPA